MRIKLDKQVAKKCIDCTKVATWVRRTQFAGDHFFCTKHAQKEKNFGQSDPSYFYWEELKSERG